jgi:hypothetical protein
MRRGLGQQALKAKQKAKQSQLPHSTVPRKLLELARFVRAKCMKSTNKVQCERKQTGPPLPIFEVKS